MPGRYKQSKRQTWQRKSGGSFCVFEEPEHLQCTWGLLCELGTAQGTSHGCSIQQEAGSVLPRSGGAEFSLLQHSVFWNRQKQLPQRKAEKCCVKPLCKLLVAQISPLPPVTE